MKKKLLTVLSATALSLSMCIPAFAGQWVSNSTGWWWQNGDGSWPANSWQWLDGNKDGVSECYYIGQDGYLLVNTTTPDGYNSISDIKFRITASHDVLSESPALKDLTGDKVTGEIELTADKTAGSLTSNIVNQKGSELPETGGMGTTAMYLVGGVLVAGALLLLITKRRMDTDR